jgi:hypothetical protein
MPTSYVYPLSDYDKKNSPSGSYTAIDDPHGAGSDADYVWGQSISPQWLKMTKGLLPASAGVLSSVKNHSRHWHSGSSGDASFTWFVAPKLSTTTGSTSGETAWQKNTHPAGTTGYATYSSSGVVGGYSPSQFNNMGIMGKKNGSFLDPRRCTWVHGDILWSPKAGMLMTFGWGWVLPILLGAGSILGPNLGAEPVSKLQPVFKKTLISQYWQGYRSPVHDNTEVSTPGSISFPHTEQEVKMLAKNLDSLKHRVTVP